MKIGERGQVTIPKRLRQRFGLRPGGEVEFLLSNGELVLRKRGASTAKLEPWRGRALPHLRKLGIDSPDDLIEELRGR